MISAAWLVFSAFKVRQHVITPLLHQILKAPERIQYKLAVPTYESKTGRHR